MCLSIFMVKCGVGESCKYVEHWGSLVLSWGSWCWGLGDEHVRTVYNQGTHRQDSVERKLSPRGGPQVKTQELIPARFSRAHSEKLLFPLPGPSPTPSNGQAGIWVTDLSTASKRQHPGQLKRALSLKPLHPHAVTSWRCI